jgi:hypothetical protein
MASNMTRLENQIRRVDTLTAFLTAALVVEPIRRLYEDTGTPVCPDILPTLCTGPKALGFKLHKQDTRPGGVWDGDNPIMGLRSGHYADGRRSWLQERRDRHSSIARKIRLHGERRERRLRLREEADNRRSERRELASRRF